MQDVFLDLTATDPSSEGPPVEIAPAAEHLRGAYEVALEADADVPSGEALRSGTFEQWRERNFGPLTIPELTFVALEGGKVVGYAILQRHTEDTGEHAMTGVARAARRRGIARALKLAQIRGARAAGYRYLRTQNDLSNAPMRRVNERLGYEPRFEWVHLTGPLPAA
jgi:GNAT superfamily N-acetyltransferase